MVSVPLKDRTALKTLADQIVRGGTAIKRAAHRFEIDEATHLQMQTIVLLVGKMQALMDSLQAHPAPEEDSTQIALALHPIVVNGIGESITEDTQ